MKTRISLKYFVNDCRYQNKIFLNTDSPRFFANFFTSLKLITLNELSHFAYSPWFLAN